MKNLIALSWLLTLLIVGAGCKKDFFEKLPPASASIDKFRDEKGIDYLLVGAYSVLDGGGAYEFNAGFPSATGEYDYNFMVGAAGTQFGLGDIRGGDANSGTEPSDGGRVPYIALERFDLNSQTGVVAGLWKARYDGISRANDVLKVINDALPEVREEFKLIRGAEARFIRAHFYFELKRAYNNIPWYDETTDTKSGYHVPNTEDIWPKIEADFQYAIDHLPVSQPEVGRATQGAARAYLAKVYMYQKKYSEALTLLNTVIGSNRYALRPNFREAFDMDFKNSQESIFAIQHTVNDGTRDGSNGNITEILHGPLDWGTGTAGVCCGFYQPTYDLVNAFQTDANGLPLLDTYQSTEVKNDYYPTPVPSDQPFTVYDGNLDPRIDWTVGRRGVPWLDWGINPGLQWIRFPASGGPFQTVKRVFTKEQKGRGSISSGTSWWAPNPNANNYDIIRFADVLLLAAEAEVEVGDLEKARDYVNRIRIRARDGQKVDVSGATHYVIGTYSAAWSDKEYARKAVRFERRLELALEGHRFYDLVRWGIAAQTLNTYFTLEKVKRPEPLGAARFTANKHEYLPIPQGDINLTSVGGQPVLQQNPGY